MIPIQNQTLRHVLLGISIVAQMILILINDICEFKIW